MVEMLFRPFDLGRWFVIGFSAWLAQFLGCSGGGGSGANLGIPPSGRGGGSGERESAVIRDLLEGRVGIGSDIERFFARIRDVLEEPAAILFAGCGVTAILGLFVLLVVIVLILLWVGSRGKFMFLDNVATGRAEIKNPWARYRSEGNSFFAWYLGYLFTALLLVLLSMTPFAVGLYGATEHRFTAWPLVVIGGVLIFTVAVILAFVNLCLDSFIVPIMHRFEVSAPDAWRKFLPLLWEHPGSFVLYALFVLVLYFGLGLALLLLGLVTCCIGWVLVAIPYLGTVLLLPVWVTLRAFSVEFLAQMIPELAIVTTSPDDGSVVPGDLEE